MEEMDERVKEHLLALPQADLLQLLTEVFDSRLPYPDDVAWNQSTFFLGIATRELLSGKDEAGRWGNWRIGAACPPDPSAYGGKEEKSADDCLFQHGTCGVCGTDLSSHRKIGLCPICGSRVLLT